MYFQRLISCFLGAKVFSLPFFVCSEENLRAALGKMGVGNRAVEDVIGKVRNRHYQVNIQSLMLFYCFWLFLFIFQ